MVVCDTQVVIWAAMQPDRLSTNVRALLDTATHTESLACADITLWEIAMLLRKRRLVVEAPIGKFIAGVLDARGYKVLPIVPEIAELAQSEVFSHADPADRLIAATAWHHHATLVTSDAKLQAVPGLKTYF